MKGNQLNEEQLKDRAIRFYEKYGNELSSIANLLEIRLGQLTLAYTLQNNLPKESITIKSRVKNLNSFLLKLESLQWPNFYYPAEIARDLIGARIICWFVDDCYGLMEYIKKSNRFTVNAAGIKDYIKNPMKQGYRAIHIPVEIKYDSVQRDKKGKIKINNEPVLCEIQIRSALQNVWGDITHQFYCKNKTSQASDPEFESLLSGIADRLFHEEPVFIKCRERYQKIEISTKKNNARTGFKEDK